MNDNPSAAISEALTVRLWCRSGVARQIRIAAGATCEYTAQMAATTQPNVSRWERNERLPNGALAVRYYRALVQLQEITAAAATESAVSA